VDLAIVITVVVVALAFDYTNGFHDAANAIATSVSTRALTPRLALTLAAVMNFVGALLGQEVAHTVSDTIAVPKGNHGLIIVLAALLGAITWNLITWYFGLPSSSSHALIGGLGGAAIAAGATVHWKTILDKVVIPMVISPVVGFIAAFLVMLAIMWIFRRRNPHKVQRGFRLMQTVSAAALALGHGLQDAQKTMGVILLAVIAAGYYPEDQQNLPLWIVISAASAISLGTYAGGWRIMRTLGRKIIALDPPRGFSAESVGAAVLYTTAFVYHAPISTTHTITSAIMGAGATRRFSAVRWGVARSIVTAWVLTFLAAGAAAAFVYLVMKFVFQLP
jgi:inorganic phosphate transporter, PiT family